MTTLGVGLGGALAPLGTPVTANITFVAQFYAELADTVEPADTVMVALPALASSTMSVNAIPRIVRAVPMEALDDLEVGVSLQAFFGMRVLETIAILDTLSRNSRDGVRIADLTTLVDLTARGAPAQIADSVLLTDTLLVIRAVQVLEALELTPLLLPARVARLSIADTIRVTASLARFFGAEAEDQMNLTETLLGARTTFAAPSESLAITAALTPQFLLRVTLEDTVDVDAVQALQMLFKPLLTEVLEIAAGYVSPDGNLTTWAMNTRTAAVTEYDNFEFNSFGVIAGRSVGATADGLYELTGDDDAGDAIIARIKGGFMQFGGTKLSSLKAAYLATRGDAEFILRIETGQGELYNYAVSTRDMRSTKVHMGKGLRARYFSFELISAGEDFDIDTLEFIPIVVARRV